MEIKRINRRKFVGQSVALSASILSYRSILGANGRIGIGMIGCGARAQDSLLKDILQFRDDTNVEVVAICDTWKQMREKGIEQVRQATGKSPKGFVRYQDLLAAS
jgi:predicted dehydrogenase